MASHGRRYASSRTKQIKQYKKLQKKANRKLRKLNKSKFGGASNPAVKNYTSNGVFLPAAGQTINEMRKNYAKMNKFVHSETSTPRGAKRVLKQTIGNIFAGHGQTTQEEIRMMNNIEVFYNDPERGSILVAKYFDVFYKVKDKLYSLHIGNISSDEIMNSIKEVIDSNELITSTRVGLSNVKISDSASVSYIRLFEQVLDTAELIERVISRLE